MHYSSVSYKMFTVANYVFMGLLGVLCLLPLVHMLAVSFSSPAPASANMVGIWPIGFTLDSYVKTLGNDNFLRALWNGIFRTVTGTLLSMLLITLAAYALSKDNREFRGRTFYMWAFVFTMLLHAGLIPSYILVQYLGLMNTVWALILPHAVNVFNMILLLNFFRTSVPKALEEAAYMDGAGHFRTVVSVYLPLSLPAIATVSLFTMVGQWNSWFDGLIYMTKAHNYPLATFLQTIIAQRDMSSLNVSAEDMEQLNEQTVRASQMFIGAVPILLVYPFLQKYFVKGLVMGSVKE
ncbi:carbohydrate ABC transporter permease [Paenibacillus thalictri]|uniref:Carbohydrate ABC transporter permease n=1 Tax=Paenibacillus thalictri TaxID=2527873 RepID=A0A4Q9DH24_9BACL|nr:carbohydrate ABC transporter permease [Paenibacillus thalictri]TBL71594.1 carbohydrate ABC transporter permease [Paenibacillus thalictri]